jgi:Resolvase, N terminal domain
VRGGVDGLPPDPENQLHELRAWVASSGHVIRGEYVDYESGQKGTEKRKQFAALFNDAAKRQFDCVLFWALDRFITTFWIGLLYFFVGVLTLHFAIGVLILLWWVIWIVIRCVKGLLALNMGEPIRHPNSSSKRRESALLCAIDLSLQTSDRTSEMFCIRLSLAAKSRFPAGETDLNGDLVRLRHLLRRKAKHLVLPGPLQGKVGKSSDSYSVWQSTLDGGLDEIGCKEGQRDHHVDLSGATPFPFCNGLGTRRCGSDQFIEPVTTTRN